MITQILNSKKGKAMVIAKGWMGEEGVNLQGTRGKGLGKGTCCISDLGGGYTTV